jgi:molybdopterin molybdotransferase
MRAAMQAAGVELDFWKVRIKPGKPLVVGEHEHCLVLGLPGNPVSAQLTCCLFVQPLLYAMQHAKHPLPKRTIAVLGETVSQKPGRLGFLRVRMAGEQVFPLHNQSSGFAGSLAHADALALIPEQCAKLEAGERVELLMLN